MGIEGGVDEIAFRIICGDLREIGTCEGGVLSFEIIGMLDEA